MKKLAPVVFAATLLLSGCGGGGGSTKDDAKTKPTAASGTKITGEGYSYQLPDGWSDQTEKFKSFNERVTSGGAAKKQTKGFTSNVNLIVTPDVGGPFAGDPDKLFEQLKSEDSQMLPDLKRLDDIELDGEAATALTGTVNGDANGLVQVGTVRDDDIYLLSISFSKDTSDSEQKGLMNSITDSWSWE